MQSNYKCKSIFRLTIYIIDVPQKQQFLPVPQSPSSYPLAILIKVYNQKSATKT